MIATQPELKTGSPDSMRQGPALRVPALVGLSTGIAFVAVFGIAATVAPLESAAVAPAVVLVDGNRKTVQHLEGGIVAELRVREGSVVKSGEIVLRLDDTLARATVDQLVGQLRATMAQEARLIAERDDAREVAFPPELMSVSQDATVAEMLSAQRRILANRREGVLSQTVILQQRNSQADEQIIGLKAQVRSMERQHNLIQEEVDGVETLVKLGLEKKPRLLQLQRTMTEIEGRRAQNVAEIARIRQVIGENELRITDLRTQLLNESLKNLREEQTRIYDLRERLRAAEDVLARTLVRAPVSGKIVGLRFFTIGGVIQPREPLMDIVPAEDALVVEAQVSPADIETVRVGLPVRLQFTSFNHWSTPPIDGTVLDVSGDRLTDQRTGISHFSARIGIKSEQLGQHNLELRAGMPAEAMIVTGRRTMMEYLLKPVTDTMRRSLKED